MALSTKLRGWLSHLTLPWLLITTLLVVLVIWLGWFRAIPYFGWESGQFGDPFGILYTLFTGITLSAIVVALSQLWREVKRAERARLDSAEELARLFYNPNMEAARNEAFNTRVGWFRQSFDHTEFARYWVDREHPVAVAGTENAGSRAAERTAVVRSPDPMPTSRLIEYYVVLYHRLRTLPADAESRELKRELIRRYLWAYWRGYLIELARTVEEQYRLQAKHHPEQAGQFPLVSWVKDLKKLDGLSGLPDYDRDNHPFDRQHTTI